MDRTTACWVCDDRTDVDELRCDGCGAVQLAHRGVIAAAAILALLLLPLTASALRVAASYGVPSGVGEGLGTGIVLGLGAIPFVIGAFAVGGYRIRQRAGV